MAITFDNSEYVKSHGKNPTGRGSWAFSVDRDGKHSVLFSPSMTLTDAKKWVKAELATKAGVTGALLYVLP